MDHTPLPPNSAIFGPSCSVSFLFLALGKGEGRKERGCGKRGYGVKGEHPKPTVHKSKYKFTISTSVHVPKTFHQVNTAMLNALLLVYKY